MKMRRIVPLAAALLAGALCGCTNRVAKLDAEELQDPLVRKALAREDEGRRDAAIRLYVEVLDRNPKMARAHLNLALLQQDFQKDYVGAIYHYQRYLELRPQSDKRQLVEDRIRLASQLFAAAVQRPGAHGAATLNRGTRSTRAAELEAENAALKRRLKEVVESQAKPSARTAPSAAARTYRVQAGDTLSRIAAKVYGDAAQWKKLYEANRDTIDQTGRLKVDQVLSVP